MKAIFPIFVIVMISFLKSYGQEVAQPSTGIVFGVLKDSTQKMPLRSATVSIYKSLDTMLVAYQLSGNLGNFKFSKIPTGTNLQLIVSFIGYRTYKKQFSIPIGSSSYDFKEILMDAEAVELNTVEIRRYRPPVEMRGDTLEFNADAFKTAKNAVVEDLLKKMPGVIVWGDGLITVNGKTVKKVLVEGKPFFGGDTKVAIQNLPKEAVDKVQLYKSSNDWNAKLDSSLNMNIKLKKGWKSGIFGKISQGYGTDNRYNSQISLNTFSPRTQFAAGFASNNNNVLVNNIGEVIKNSSFKGTGVDLDLQPDFFTEGLNRSTSGGFSLSHDFTEAVFDKRANKLESDYFLSNRTTDAIRNTLSTINIKADSNLYQKSDEKRTGSILKHNFNNVYNFENESTKFRIIPEIQISRSKNTSDFNTASLNDGGVMQSSSSKYVDDDLSAQKYSVNIFYRNKTHGFSLASSSSLDNRSNLRLDRSSFQSFSSIERPTRLERYYDQNIKHSANSLLLKLERLDSYLGLDKIARMSFENSISFGSDKTDNRVDDLKDNIKSKVNNTYLTNVNTFRTIDDKPTIKVEKVIEKSLLNRFSSQLYMGLDLMGQVYSQSSRSQKDYQQFDDTYLSFLPAATLRYNYYSDLTRYKSSYEINYNSSRSYPTIDQIAPLVDSANFYFRQIGNGSLIPSYRKDLSLSYRLEDYNKKNSTDSYQLRIKLSSINNAITNSVVYDSLGRGTGKFININGTKYISLYGEFRKAFKLRGNLLQFILKPSIDQSIQPTFINGLYNRTNLLETSNNLTVSYLLKDILQVELSQQYMSNRIKEANGNIAFKSSLIGTRFCASLNFTKSLNLNTNITYNINSVPYSKSYSFTLWNTNLTYRFLKGNQAELKIAALDILHQNKGVINYTAVNTLTTGFTNVMQQYFMVTLAYYPRIFGKGK
ncbi:hypothetical protein [Pedobacter suwonensis]